MCGDRPKGGEGGMHRGKGSTLRHYEGEARKGGWLMSRIRWIFFQLDQHEESCKWRRFAYAVIRRTG